MKRKFLLVLLAIISAIVCAFGISACTTRNDDSSNSNSGGATGIYYLYENNKLDKSQYIKIDSNKWSDDDNVSGTYKVSGTSITFYSEVFGSNEEMYSGTLSDGKLTIKVFGSTMTYYKEGKEPSNSGTGNDNPNHTHSWSTSLSSDDNYHWYACSGCDEKKDNAQHYFVDGKCVCGKEKGSEGPDIPVKTEFDVTFNLNYSGASTVTRSTEDKLITYIPTRNGFEFNGWYLDSELLHLFDIDSEVNADGLVLYASWVEAATEVGQLSAPIVSVTDNVFSWKSVTGATGYRVVVSLSNTKEDVIDESISRTSWTFPQSLDAGIYTVKIRAIGDGITTVNSVYASRNYSLRVLGAISGISLDRATSILSWNEVENAEEYQIYIGNNLVGSQAETEIDLSNFDAGALSVRINATRENWLTSSGTANLSKMRLKTPEVIVTINENKEYVLKWDSVRYADTFILKYGEKEIEIKDTTYTINQNSVIWNGQNTTSFVINAFDSKADYLISSGAKEITINKVFNLNVESNNNEAGNVGVEGKVWQNIIVSFDLNGASGSVASQTITTTQGLVYPEIPTRSGYIFRGWFTESSCENVFDFTSTVEKSITLYAGWFSTSNKTFKELNSGSSSYSSSSSYRYTYFRALSGSQIRIGYSQSSSSPTSYMLIYDVTKDELWSEEQSFRNTTPGTTYFYPSAGHVYYVRTRSSASTNISLSFTTYPSDTYLPNDGGKAKADYIISDSLNAETNYALYGKEYKLTAVTVDDNYIFSGWYNGETKLTDELTYTFAMPAEDVTYTAKWVYYSITTEKNISEAGNISNFSDTPTKVGEEITITATTNNGYTWLGWYNGETKLTDELSYTFAMPAENVTYVAKWTFYTLTISDQDDESERTARVQFNLNGASGSAPATQIVTKSNKLVYPAIPTRSGYVFAGWYNNSSCSGNAFDFSARVTGDTILYAKWVAYSGNGVIPYNGNITISVVSKSSSTVYYAFVPLVSGTVSIYSTGSLDTYGYLYSSTKSQLATDDDGGDGNNFKITYSVTAGTLYYVRPCGYSSSGTTTVYVSGSAVSDSGTTGESNKGTVKVNGSNYSGNATKITAGQNVTITAITNSGYTWLGWYNGETELTKELSYTFTMPSENVTYIAKWIACPVTLEQNDTTAGTISSLTGKYKVGDNVTVTATTNYGYTWLGWYNGETELTKELSYTFTMPSENVTYTAKWACYTLTTDTNIDYAGSYTNKNEVKTTAGQSVSLTASTYNGYTWLGWYNGDTLLSQELNYTFDMPSQSITYTARWAYYTVTTSRNDTAAGTINSFNNTKITVGNEVNLTAKTNNGYTWLGWYNGDELVSKELNYTFEMPAENIEYIAKWRTCPISIEKNIDEAGRLGAIDKVTVVGNDTTISATTNDGYTWLGWYDGDELLTTSLSYTFAVPMEEVTYTAKWDCYTLTFDTDEGGSVSWIDTSYTVTFDLNGASGNIEPQIVTEKVGLKYPDIPTRSGYVFMGWCVDKSYSSYFDFSKEVTSDVTLYAHWVSRSGTIIRVNQYTSSNQGEVSTKSVSSKFVYFSVPFTGMYTFSFSSSYYSGTAYRTQVVITDANSTSSYDYMYRKSFQSNDSDYINFGTFYAGQVYKLSFNNLSSSTSSEYATIKYTFTYYSGAQYMPYEGGCLKNNGIKNDGNKITAGEQITLTATPDDNYAFNGWYDGETLVSRDLVFTFAMPNHSVNYQAKWVVLPVSISKNIDAAGQISGLENLSIGKEATISAVTNSGYTWLGWYDGEVLLTTNLRYSFELTLDSKEYTAKWTYYTLTTNANIANAGTFTNYNSTQVTVGNKVSLTATSNDGYIFVGWYNGSELLSNQMSYKFTMIDDNITLTAHWIESNLVVSKNVDLAGEISDVSNLYLGQKVTVKVNSTNIGYNFDGWYKNDILLTNNTSYQFTVTEEEATYEARWSVVNELLDFEFVSSTTECTITGVKNKTLTEIEVPSCVTAISKGAFSGCASLTKLTLPFIGESKDASGNKAVLGYIFGTTSYTGGQAVEQRFYQYTTNPNWITYYIPSSLRNVIITGGTVPYGAFSYCSMLTTIEIPNNVTSIGTQAFANCSSLTTVNIPSTVKSIGEKAFYCDTKLKSINIPEGVTAIGSDTFNCCSALTSIVLPSTLTSIGAQAFTACTGLKSITIPEKVTIIYNEAFAQCYALSEIKFNAKSCILSTVGSAEKSAFRYAGRDTSGISVVIGANVTKIPANLFYYSNATYAPKIKSVTFANGSVCSKIETFAFGNCATLTSFNIPASVTQIEASAFSGCSSLSSVSFSNTSGWKVYTSASSTSGTSVTVTSASTCATNLTSKYCTYYWKRT